MMVPDMSMNIYLINIYFSRDDTVDSILHICSNKCWTSTFLMLKPKRHTCY